MQSVDRSRGLALGMVLGITACGDDGTATTDADESGSSSTGIEPVDSSGGSSADDDADDTLEPDSSGSTTAPADESSSDSTTAVADESSTGVPNEPPTAVDDAYLVTMGGSPLQIDAALGVLANDVDPEGGPLQVDASDALSLRANAVDVQTDGAFALTFPAAMWGQDRFGYTVADDAGATDDAIVRVMIAPTTVDAGELDGDAPGFTIAGAADLDETGYAVAGGGDVNGDGFADVVVGARTADRVWVAFGKADGDPVAVGDANGFSIDGLDGTQTGHAVAVAGDVNGDGLADVVVGAPLADPLGNDEGTAWVVFGKADTTAVVLATLEADGNGFAIDGLAGDDALGFGVGGGGDVNGDGLDDVIVGAPQADVGVLANAGRAWVVHGKGDTAPVDLAQVAAGVGGFELRGFDADARAGDAVDIVGDVNGDGLDDFVVASPLADPAGGNSGEVYVVWGKSDGTPIDLDDIVAGTGGFAIAGEEALDQAGDAVARAGDVNGDGLADLVVGGPGAEADPDVADITGRAYVVLGKDDELAVDLVDVAAGIGGFVVDGTTQFDFSGYSVGGGGDVDGDGLADVVVGAHGIDIAAFGAGRVHVVYGRTDTDAIALADIALGDGGFAIDGEATNDILGWSSALGGDVSGDGLADVVGGAPEAVGGNGEGRAYVIFGGSFRGFVTHAGTDADDTIVGTAGVDAIVGGLGDDSLASGGGFDIVYGGAGDDAIVLSSTDLFRIDGGTGFDTIVLDGSGLGLELGTYSELAIVGIEAIDLTGTGDNQLFLETRDLRALSDTANVLVVVGDDGDQVVADLAGGGFVDAGIVDGFQSWTTGVLTLAVAVEVEAFVGT